MSNNLRRRARAHNGLVLARASGLSHTHDDVCRKSLISSSASSFYKIYLRVRVTCTHTHIRYGAPVSGRPTDLSTRRGDRESAFFRTTFSPCSGSPMTRDDNTRAILRIHTTHLSPSIRRRRLHGRRNFFLFTNVSLAYDDKNVVRGGGEIQSRLETCSTRRRKPYVVN